MAAEKASGEQKKTLSDKALRLIQAHDRAIAAVSSEHEGPYVPTSILRT